MYKDKVGVALERRMALPVKMYVSYILYPISWPAFLYTALDTSEHFESEQKHTETRHWTDMSENHFLGGEVVYVSIYIHFGMQTHCSMTQAFRTQKTSCFCPCFSDVVVPKYSRG